LLSKLPTQQEPSNDVILDLSSASLSLGVKKAFDIWKISHEKIFFLFKLQSEDKLRVEFQSFEGNIREA